MNFQRTVIAVDAGGSKTDIVIARVSDEPTPVILARHASPAANLNTVGVEPALDLLAAGIATTVAQAGVAMDDLEVAILAFAGAAEREVRSTVEEWCAERRLAQRIIVMSDAELILTIAESASVEHQAAIGLIAGTGSVAFGRREDADEMIRAGGWGPLLGDDGGGFWIGRELVRTICRDEDCEQPRSPLARRILADFHVDSSRGLIACIAKAANQATAIASLARTVLTAATDGDSQALELVQGAGERLVDLVRTVANRLDLPAATISMACAGGLLTPTSPLAEQLERAMREAGIGSLLFVDEPALAALQLAAMLE